MTLPVYYQAGSKKILVGMNKYERMHFQPRNKMKQYYYDMIARNIKDIHIHGQVKTRYTYFFKNSQSDAPNVVAVIDKMFMDALQKIGVIQEDNVKHYIGSSWSVGGQDKENPRMEIEIIDIV